MMRLINWSGLALCIASLATTACTTRLTQPEGHEPEICTLTAPACYAKGANRFAAYRTQRTAEVNEKSNGFRLPSAPIAALTGERTEYVAVLIHGLNDSAYYMADIARVFADHGINAVTVLLPGHGTFTEDTLAVKAEDWRREVSTGLEIAALLGEKVILAGFSLGASLAIDSVLRGREIHGLVLFSPTLELQNKVVGPLTCLPIVRSRYLTTDLPRNPVKYSRRSGNGVCQLRRIMKENLRRSAIDHSPAPGGEDKFKILAAQIKVPTIIVLTFGDIRVTPASVLSFANRIDAPTLLATYGAPAGITGSLANGGEIKNLEEDLLPHSHLLRKTNEYNMQINPYFDGLQSELSAFIRKHFQ